MLLSAILPLARGRHTCNVALTDWHSLWHVGQFFHTGAWLGGIVLRPAVETAFLYGRLTRRAHLSCELAEAVIEYSICG
jgi:hypothetical protein